MFIRGTPVNQSGASVPPSSSIERIAEAEADRAVDGEPMDVPSCEGEEGDSLRSVRAVKVRDARLTPYWSGGDGLVDGDPLG